MNSKDYNSMRQTGEEASRDWDNKAETSNTETAMMYSMGRGGRAEEARERRRVAAAEGEESGGGRGTWTIWQATT